jgi:hypothetical protein
MRKMPRLSSNALPFLLEMLGKKASQSRSKYRISAMAFDKRGEFIGRAFNGLPPDGVEGKPGIGVHAEYKLMMKYGDLIKTIFISRIGHSGEWRPIKPCANCQALADKLGIKLITIKECQ